MLGSETTGLSGTKRKAARTWHREKLKVEKVKASSVRCWVHAIMQTVMKRSQKTKRTACSNGKVIREGAKARDAADDARSNFKDTERK